MNSSISKSSNLNFDCDQLFKNIKLKKQYINILNNKVYKLQIIKEQNYKNLNFSSFLKTKVPILQEDFLVSYIIDITFARSNTLLNIMDSSGNLKFFLSAGLLNYKGKRKKSRSPIMADFLKVIISKFKFLKKHPVALHFKNPILSNSRWLTRQLEKKLFVRVVRFFVLYPHNGCRKKKIRRKKFRRRRKK
jgi:hypothetical protein